MFAGMMFFWAGVVFVLRQYLVSLRSPTTEKAVIPKYSSPLVLGTGSAFGNTFTTEQMLLAFHEQRRRVGDYEYDKVFADTVFSRCGFQGHSVGLPLKNLFRTMNRDEYLQHRATCLVDMAAEACREALQMWGGAASDITHLLWGTMTGGMQSPSIDQALVEKLGLTLDVVRLNVENSGCLTGFRLVNIAADIIRGNESKRILVVAGDLRSFLGNSLPDRCKRADIVSCSLFRDGASAVVMGGFPRKTEQPLFEVIAGKSRILPNSRHCVDYKELASGAIRLHLSKDLPLLVAAAEPAFVSDLLALAQGAIGGTKIPPLLHFDIVCHTGGPKVLRELTAALGACEEQLESSWAVMRAHGNLSGASNMAVLDHLVRKQRSKRMWALCLSMGPGMSLEGIVLRRIEAQS